MTLSWKPMLAILGFIIISVACNPFRYDANSPTATSEKGAKMDNAFVIHILKENRHSIYFGNSFEESWAVLKKVNLAQQRSTISSSDIAMYDWSQQVITLTLEASNRLREDWANKPNDIALLQHAFVVTFNDERLYGGLFTEEGSASRLSYPVIYPDFSKTQIVLYLRPDNAHGLLTPYRELDSNIRQRIEIDSVRTYFQELGKLIE